MCWGFAVSPHQPALFQATEKVVEVEIDVKKARLGVGRERSGTKQRPHRKRPTQELAKT